MRSDGQKHQRPGVGPRRQQLTVRSGQFVYRKAVIYGNTA
jgi:hypothetical protein